jgi:glycosyltransferase involved in cell wall biosynthesis
VDGIARSAPEQGQTLVEYDQVFDISWSRNPLDPRNFYQAIPQFQKQVRTGCYDLVHVHTPIAAFVSRLSLRTMTMQNKPKIIYTAHGFHFYHGAPWLNNLIFLFLEKLAGNWTDYLVTINEEDYNAAKRFKIVSADSLQLMPGIGVDMDYYSRANVDPIAALRIRKELGLSDSDKLFLMVALFIPGKRHVDALEAFSKIRIPDVHLALAGTGSLMGQIQQIVVDMDIENKVHFLGMRQDIPELMYASNAVILPSVREGLPRCVLEALSLQTPVIGTDIRGTRDLLRNSAGLMVRVGDTDALANAMEWIINNPNEAEEMGWRGRAEIEPYRLRRVLRLHEELYARLLASEEGGE